MPKLPPGGKYPPVKNHCATQFSLRLFPTMTIYQSDRQPHSRKYGIVWVGIALIGMVWTGRGGGGGGSCPRTMFNMKWKFKSILIIPLKWPPDVWQAPNWQIKRIHKPDMKGRTVTVMLAVCQGDHSWFCKFNIRSAWAVPHVWTATLTEADPTDWQMCQWSEQIFAVVSLTCFTQWALGFVSKHIPKPLAPSISFP